MKSWFAKTTVWGVALLAMVTVCAGQTEDVHDRESRVLALENAWSRAEERQDVKALDPLLDNRLLFVHYDGVVWTKAQYLASLKEPGFHEEQGVTEGMSVRVFGTSAVVVGIFRLKGTDKGKPFLRRERFLDVWVEEDGKWTCVASEILLLPH